MYDDVAHEPDPAARFKAFGELEVDGRKFGGVAVSPDFEHFGGIFSAHNSGFACTAGNGLAAIVALCKASASGPAVAPCVLSNINPSTCK